MVFSLFSFDGGSEDCLNIGALDDRSKEVLMVNMWNVVLGSA